VEGTYKAVEDGRTGKGVAQPLIVGARSSSRSTAKTMNIALWVLQIGAAGMFLVVGFFKLSGDPRMVGLFDAIGVGQWFRYVTGSLEVLGAILLLIPRLSGLGALLLVGVMLGAVATHLFIVGGSPPRGDHSLDCHGRYRVGTTQANDESLRRDTVRIEYW
jgi:putative oxidoreductase